MLVNELVTNGNCEVSLMHDILRNNVTKPLARTFKFDIPCTVELPMDGCSPGGPTDCTVTIGSSHLFHRIMSDWVNIRGVLILLNFVPTQAHPDCCSHSITMVVCTPTRTKTSKISISSTPQGLQSQRIKTCFLSLVKVHLH